MSLIRKHGAVLQAWACLDLVSVVNVNSIMSLNQMKIASISNSFEQLYLGWQFASVSFYQASAKPREFQGHRSKIKVIRPDFRFIHHCGIGQKVR